jgi:hypothetical protein
MPKMSERLSRLEGRVGARRRSADLARLEEQVARFLDSIPPWAADRVVTLVSTLDDPGATIERKIGNVIEFLRLEWLLRESELAGEPWQTWSPGVPDVGIDIIFGPETEAGQALVETEEFRSWRAQWRHQIRRALGLAPGAPLPEIKAMTAHGWKAWRDDLVRQVGDEERRAEERRPLWEKWEAEDRARAAARGITGAERPAG